VRVEVKQPLTTYRQVPSDLSHVTSSSFVGVASLKQANGTELATQIKIFPAELRGAGEGISMMDTAPGVTTHSRMTDGSVSRPAVSNSRMTNGTVQKGNGSTLVVHYQGRKQSLCAKYSGDRSRTGKGQLGRRRHHIRCDYKTAKRDLCYEQDLSDRRSGA
jgi:hypothetical protein